MDDVYCTKQPEENATETAWIDFTNCKRSTVTKEEVELPDLLLWENGEISASAIKTEPLVDLENEDSGVIKKEIKEEPDFEKGEVQFLALKTEPLVELENEDSGVIKEEIKKEPGLLPSEKGEVHFLALKTEPLVDSENDPDSNIKQRDSELSVPQLAPSSDDSASDDSAVQGSGSPKKTFVIRNSSEVLQRLSLPNDQPELSSNETALEKKSLTGNNTKEMVIRECSVVLQRCQIPNDRPGPSLKRKALNTKSFTGNELKDKLPSDGNSYDCKNKCNRDGQIKIRRKKERRKLTTNDLFECNECQKLFSDKQRLKSHVTMHLGVKPFRCKKCQKSFAQKGELNTHIRYHSGVRPYECGECQKSFFSKTDLTRHLFIHLGLKLYQCDKCEKSFTIRSKLMSHRRIHSTVPQVELYQCEKCQKSFSRKCDIVQHVNSHLETKHQCDKCEKSFTTRTELTSHRMIHLIIPQVELYQCDKCQKSFKIKHEFLSHRMIHLLETPYKCDRCQMPYLEKHYLISHMQKHSKVKHNKCDPCPKSIRSRLSAHEEIHSAQKECKSNQCQKSFAENSNLTKETHIQAPDTVGRTVSPIQSEISVVTLDDKDQPLITMERLNENTRKESADTSPSPPPQVELYQCDKCQKSFSRKRNIIRHIKAHFKAKRYQFEKRITRSDSRSHGKIHSLEAPYKCDQCQMSFLEESYYTSHVMSHSEAEIYECDQCHKSYFSGNSLGAHKKVHSAIERYKSNQRQKSLALKSNLTTYVPIRPRYTAGTTLISTQREIPRGSVGDQGQPPLNMESLDKNKQKDKGNASLFVKYPEVQLYHCNKCEKSFTIKSKLLSHRMIHLLETPYKCDQCKIPFLEKSYLISHMEGHSKVKHNKCDPCPKSVRSRLSAHKEIQSAQKKYKSKQSYKSFSEKSNRTKYVPIRPRDTVKTTTTRMESEISVVTLDDEDQPSISMESLHKNLQKDGGDTLLSYAPPLPGVAPLANVAPVSNVIPLPSVGPLPYVSPASYVPPLSYVSPVSYVPAISYVPAYVTTVPTINMGVLPMGNVVLVPNNNTTYYYTQ